jgi:hypothetical protein
MITYNFPAISGNYTSLQLVEKSRPNGKKSAVLKITCYVYLNGKTNMNINCLEI